MASDILKKNISDETFLSQSCFLAENVGHTANEFHPKYIDGKYGFQQMCALAYTVKNILKVVELPTEEPIGNGGGDSHECDDGNNSR